MERPRFLGEYPHSLDAKGRVILPARFRPRLGGGCVLTIGPDHCLRGYPVEEWERVAERLSQDRIDHPERRDAIRRIFANAVEDAPDTQGRFFIPEQLRAHAGLDRDLIITGQHEYFEIWDRARWGSRMEPQAGDEPALPY